MEKCNLEKYRERWHFGGYWHNYWWSHWAKFCWQPVNLPGIPALKETTAYVYVFFSFTELFQKATTSLARGMSRCSSPRAVKWSGSVREWDNLQIEAMKLLCGWGDCHLIVQKRRLPSFLQVTSLLSLSS